MHAFHTNQQDTKTQQQQQQQQQLVDHEFRLANVAQLQKSNPYATAVGIKWNSISTDAQDVYRAHVNMQKSEYNPVLTTKALKTVFVDMDNVLA